MTLLELQEYYKTDAEQLGDYSLLTKEELGNGYIDAFDAGDDILASSYFSAIVLRYWYKAIEWRDTSTSLRLPDTDFVDWLCDEIIYTMDRRVWRTEGHVLYGDPNGFDKALNQALGSKRDTVYQYYNKQKRKANVHTYSLDAMVEEDGDYAIQQTGCYTDRIKTVGNIYLLVNDLISRDEALEALIVDGIANFDTYKEEKYEVVEEVYDINEKAYKEEKIKKVHTSFDKRKLVKHLDAVDMSFITKFCECYDVTNEVGQTLLKDLKKMDHTKLYTKIEKILTEIRQTPELLSYVAK